MPHVRALTAAFAASVALAACLTLAAAVETAAARAIWFSNQNIRATWTSLEWVTIVGTIRCQVTLEGSFHAPRIPKIRATLIGTITRSTVNEAACTGGRARPKNLPWTQSYEGFTGTLPSFTGLLVGLSRFRYELTVPGLCTGDYGTESDKVTLQASREASNGVTDLSPVAGSNTFNRVSGTAFCPSSGTLAGTGRLTRLETTTRIALTLI